MLGVSVLQSTYPHGVRLLPALGMAAHSPFQSTHPHGVRPKLAALITRSALFQSTHPHGVRLVVPPLLVEERLVSIHAPTWGATYYPVGRRHRRGCFNPRTHMGCDPGYQGKGVSSPKFQSTHPHGVRRQNSNTYARLR